MELEIVKQIAKDIYQDIYSKEQLKGLLQEFQRFEDFLAEAQIERLIVDITLSPTELAKKISAILEDFKTEEVILLNLIDYVRESKYHFLFNANNFKLLRQEISTLAQSKKVLKLTVPVELKEIDLVEIKTRLEKKYRHGVFLQVQVRPNLIGGFILEKDSMIIDASVEKAFEDYRRDWSHSLT
jgi:F0F1-type ATP synthase delta subunit